MAENELISRRALLHTGVCGLATGSLTSWGVSREAYQLQVSRTDLMLPKWDADGFRVGVIADIHLKNDQTIERARQAVLMMSQEKVDLVCLLGDFVSFTRLPIVTDIVSVLKPLAGMGCPVVAILGNHDYASRQIGRVIEGLNATTAKLLVNETLEVGGVTLAGLDDGIHGAPRFDFFGKDRVSKSLLALFHEGDRVEEMPGHVSLQLSGHSHGGQVCYPNGRPVMPAPLGEKYVAGFFADTAAPLFVSKGVGTSGPDFRLFCAPEVNVLTLRSAS